MGEVEVDETYIGGSARNMHKDKQVKKLRMKAVTAKPSSSDVGTKGRSAD